MISIGRYEVLLPIGTGGTATVYLARAPIVDELHREVAVKVLHPQHDGEMLIEEARLAARIRHPNVVAVTEVGRDESGTFLVMEYVEGDTVSKLCRPGVARAVLGRILVDMLAGLHAAHELTDERGQSLCLVHRDVTPQNVLVGVDGVTRLTDFGIARAVGRASHTAEGLLKGKAAYMSPEQALGKLLDRRCDVWAAGVIAWELVAQKRLHPASDNASTLLRVVMEPPPRLTGVPDALADAIASALEPDLEQRCPTAHELRARLLRTWPEPIADTSDVAEFVRAATRDQCEQRRRAIDDVLTSRTHAPVADATADDLTIPVTAPPPQKRRGLYVAAALAVVVGLFGRELSRRAPPITPAPALAAPAAEKPAKTVHVRSIVPVARVYADDRIILDLASPALELDVVTSSSALTVVAADGRSVEVTVTGANVEVPLAPLPAPVQAPAKATKPAAKKPVKPPPTSDLAPPPYKKP